MMETWDLLHSPAAGAVANMALDEALLHTAAERGQPLLRVYTWARLSVSVGYFQKFPAHLADKYEIVRRSTGGGLVYHGAGVDTTYTVVVPPEHRLYAMGAADAYGTIHKAVAAAIEDCSRESHSRRSASVPRKSFAATIPALHKAQIAAPHGAYECFQNPVRGDVVAGGKKLAGAAQRRTKWGLLHQGSIAANVTAEGLVRGFSRILSVAWEDHQPTNTEFALAEKLAREKYATDAWNRR